MGREDDLLAAYPRTPRDVAGRGASKTEEDRTIARRFDRDFFDGDRRVGYGGYRYHPRFWKPVVPAFRAHFGLAAGSKVLDVGCGKGFMLHDLAEDVPGLEPYGLDVSRYATANAMEDVRGRLVVGTARDLPYPSRSFDAVVSVNTVHNLERAACIRALREIERVGRGKAFVTVDAYRNDEERERMLAWNLTARTVLHVDDWRALFAEAGYGGDYHWFIP